MTKVELCGQRQEVRDLFLNKAIITRIKLTHQERACKLNLLILLFDEHFLTSKRLSDFVGFCQPIKLVSTLLQEIIKRRESPWQQGKPLSREVKLGPIGTHRYSPIGVAHNWREMCVTKDI